MCFATARQLAIRNGLGRAKPSPKGSPQTGALHCELMLSAMSLLGMPNAVMLMPCVAMVGRDLALQFGKPLGVVGGRCNPQFTWRLRGTKDHRFHESCFHQKTTDSLSSSQAANFAVHKL